MKLIIDIPEMFYQNKKENKGYVSDLKRDIVWDAMIKGTPLVEQEPILDKIRAELEQAAFNDVIGSKYIFVNRVNQIIDKYKVEGSE